jgi:hypothetical protein
MAAGPGGIALAGNSVVRSVRPSAIALFASARSPLCLLLETFAAGRKDRELYLQERQLVLRISSAGRYEQTADWRSCGGSFWQRDADPA